MTRPPIAASGAIGSWHTGSLASHANELAALPSLHIAWAAWCTLAVWQGTRRAWARTCAVLYPCLTTFAVLATGNHFVLDVLTGLLTFAVSVALVRLLEGAWARRRARPAGGRGGGASGGAGAAPGRA